MLTLTLRKRYNEDHIIIRCPDGTRVHVYLAEVDRGRAKLSFHAPRNVEINREVIDRRDHPEDYPQPEQPCPPK